MPAAERMGRKSGRASSSLFAVRSGWRVTSGSRSGLKGRACHARCSSPLLLVLLAANPLDRMRVLGLVGLGADVLLGPTGAALSRLLSPMGGGALVAASLLAWCILPLALAARTFRLKDF